MEMNTFIFDLYNTLIDVRTDEHCERAWSTVIPFLAARGMHADWRTLCALYDEMWREQTEELERAGEFDVPEGDVTLVYKGMANRLGGSLDDAEAAECAVIARRASVVWLRLFDGTVELLQRLRALGCKLYLLSNAQASFTYSEIEECGLGGMFDGMLLSSEQRCRKPSAAYFDVLVKRYGIDRTQAVMVGDDPASDGEGAARAGLRFVLASGGAAAHARELLDLAEGVK